MLNKQKNKMKKLKQEEIQDKMTEINPAWCMKDNFLHRELLFKDFMEAFSFMTSVALIAEKAAHHPNWKNVYNKVIIDLNTHDADGISTKDFDLAKAIDRLLNHYEDGC